MKKATAEGRIIACAEGEKDADSLWSLGIAATCNAHGASEPGKQAKWTKAHSEQLAGADIVVFNDNDAAGYKHAAATCTQSLGIARRVRRLDLGKHWPEIPKGGDVSDWLSAGHTREELAALIETAPDYAASAEQPQAELSEQGADGTDAEIERLAKLSTIHTSRNAKARHRSLASGRRSSIGWYRLSASGLGLLTTTAGRDAPFHCPSRSRGRRRSTVSRCSMA